jgi:dTDP-glucose pyrophosphorylase
MKTLQNTSGLCLLVVDKNNKLLGTITDGDLRRSILGGSLFTDDISNSYNINPTTLTKGLFNSEEAKYQLRTKKLDLIPVVDKNNVVVEYVTWSTLGDEKMTVRLLDDVPVVIMAGGKGTRLEPFTKILPKPLVPIDGKPIIEHIIERFLDVGCNQFYLTLNYKGQILKAYFEDLQPFYKIEFLFEKEPLGTASSLSLVSGKLNAPFFVTNCDIIIKADYAELYKFHQKGDYDITLVASTKEYIIPYGTCELNSKGHLSHINEKPTYDFLINTGLYVLNPDTLDLIPDNEFYHITHLIEAAKNKGKKVGVFPIDDETWIDVGEWAEYKKVIERL